MFLKGNKIKYGVFLLVLVVSFVCGKSYGSMGASYSKPPTVRSQVAKILLSSLGGAVLGISTLSFYDRPQDHLSNVALGGTLGALAGTYYVTKESLNYESSIIDQPSIDHPSMDGLAIFPSNAITQSGSNKSTIWQVVWSARF